MVPTLSGYFTTANLHRISEEYVHLEKFIVVVMNTWRDIGMLGLMMIVAYKYLTLSSVYVCTWARLEMERMTWREHHSGAGRGAMHTHGKLSINPISSVVANYSRETQECGE